jgi:3-deoxy-D-manno-octulosonic-acid transferase
MWWIYQTLAALALLAAGPWLLAVRRRHYLPTLRGRLGGFAPATGDPQSAERPSGAFWIHAVSVGEAALAGALAARLPADLAVL